MSQYMTDEELLDLISDVEENNLVAAPPQLAEKVIEKINKKNNVLEYKRFRNRVIVSVAALLAVTINGPKWIAGGQFDIGRLHLLGDFENSYYISEFLNARED